MTYPYGEVQSGEPGPAPEHELASPAEEGGAPPPGPAPEPQPVPGAVRRALARAGRFTWNAVPGRQRADRVPMDPRLPLPGWLADRRVLVACWASTLVFIALHERQLGYPLPRPARLWAASALYAILMAAGSVEPLVPLTSALGIGYAVAVAMQYYDKAGIFGQEIVPRKPAEAGAAGGSGSPAMPGEAAPGATTGPAGPAR